MIPFRRILFPVDLSQPSRRAVPYVLAMAERFHSEIVVLHVMELPISIIAPPEGVGWVDLSNTGTLKHHRLEQFEEFVRTELGSQSVRTEFLEGDTAYEITSLAQRDSIDLIMSMTHGRGAFRRLLLGSVTAKVLHDCECAVWTGVHIPDPPDKDPARLKTILCAIDTPAKDAHVLKWAETFARLTGAVVETVHATTHADMVVQHKAQILDADLVVIGRTHSKLEALRSTAYEIIRQAPCPVISV